MNEIDSLKQVYFNEYLTRLDEINSKINTFKYEIDLSVNNSIREIYTKRTELFKQTDAIRAYLLNRLNNLELNLNDLNNKKDLDFKLNELKIFQIDYELINESSHIKLGFFYKKSAILNEQKDTILSELNQYKKTVDSLIQSKGKFQIKANKHQSVDCLTYLTKAKMFQLNKETIKAIQYVDKSLQIDSNCLKAYYLKLNILKELNLIDYAIETSDHLIKLEPNANAFNKKANLFYARKDYKKAIEYYDLALELNPFHLDSLNNKGVLLIKEMNDFKEAIKCFRLMIRIDVENPAAWNGLGVCLKRSNDLNGAIECFNHALLLDPFHASSHFNKLNLVSLLFTNASS